MIVIVITVQLKVFSLLHHAPHPPLFLRHLRWTQCVGLGVEKLSNHSISREMLPTTGGEIWILPSNIHGAAAAKPCTSSWSWCRKVQPRNTTIVVWLRSSMRDCSCRFVAALRLCYESTKACSHVNLSSERLRDIRCPEMSCGWVFCEARTSTCTCCKYLHVASTCLRASVQTGLLGRPQNKLSSTAAANSSLLTKEHRPIHLHKQKKIFWPEQVYMAMLY